MQKTAKVMIEGTTPLLFNRFIEASIDKTVKKRAGNLKSGDPAEKLYQTHDGKIYTPYTHIQGALVDAAKSFQIVGKRRSNYSKLFGCAVMVEPDIIINKNQKWTVFSISAVNPNTRGRMMVHRPMMKDWGLEFEIVFNDDDVPAEVLKNILDYAGQYSGIGDWRPNKKGKYGKFIVTEFKVK